MTGAARRRFVVGGWAAARTAAGVDARASARAVACARVPTMVRRRSSPAGTVTDQFALFLQQADHLSKRRLMKSGLDTNLAITAGGGPPTVTWKRPDEEDFRSFLVDLRPFIADGEPVFLDRIYNLIERHVTDPQLREEARQSRKILGNARDGSDLYLDDRTPAQIADAYIDGTFHVDPAARKRSTRPTGFSSDLDLWFVHSYCAGVALRVAEGASIVRRALASGTVSEMPITDAGA
jgi:hypothetical protein